MKNDEIKFKYENLYQFRKEKGISQEELGNIIGVSRQAVSKWETGERIPDINNLAALCKEFNKSFEDFIDLSNNLDSKNNKHSKKFTIKKLFKLILLLIIVFIFLNSVVKAVFINMMILKVNKYKDAEYYSFAEEINYYDYELIMKDEIISKDKYSTGKLVYFKNNVQKIQTLNMLFGDFSKWSDIGNDETYLITYDENDVNRYNYSKGVSIEASPYVLTKLNTKKFYTISYILNPFNFLQIDLKNSDLIFEEHYKIEGYKYDNFYDKTYFDINTGLLSKKESYRDNRLNYSEIYSNYKFEDDGFTKILLTEEEKDEIKSMYYNEMNKSIAGEEINN